MRHWTREVETQFQASTLFKQFKTVMRRHDFVLFPMDHEAGTRDIPDSCEIIKPLLNSEAQYRAAVFFGQVSDTCEGRHQEEQGNGLLLC